MPWRHQLAMTASRSAARAGRRGSPWRSSPSAHPRGRRQTAGWRRDTWTWPPPATLRPGEEIFSAKFTDAPLAEGKFETYLHERENAKKPHAVRLSRPQLPMVNFG